MRSRIRFFILVFATGIALSANGQSLISPAGQSNLAGSTFVSWSIGEPLIQTLAGSSFHLTQGYQQAWGRYSLYGQLSYANIWSTPLQGIQLNVHPVGSSPLRSSVSRAGGHFYLYDVPPGQYTFSAHTTRPAGSINATDALLVMKHFVQHIQLDGIFLDAADVDASGSVNANDALQICRFFVDSIASFDAGSWLIEKDTLNLLNSTAEHNLQALCYGDANASYIPGGGLKQSIYLQQSGEMRFLAEEEMRIPVRVKQASQFGAISLVLQESSGALEILGLEMQENRGSLTSSITQNGVHLAWFDLHPLELDEESVLFWIRARIKDVDALLKAGIAFHIHPESEMADENAYPYAGIDLIIPEIKIDLIPQEIFLTNLYPNPAYGQLNLRMALPEEARISIGVYDIRGALAGARPTQQLVSGIHTLEVDVTHLPAGIYFLELWVNGREREARFVRKFVRIKNR
jgi:hypothetical protein